MVETQCSDRLGYPKTDPTRWRLRCTELGATEWEYIDENDKVNDPQSFYVKQDLGCLTNEENSKLIEEVSQGLESFSPAMKSAIKGGRFFQKLQDSNSGIFPMQYKGPMFMSIGFIACYQVSETPIPEPIKIEMIRYLINTSHPVDGGWGLHEFDKSTCFGTTLGYIILRILGLEKNDPICIKARNTLIRLGGAIKNPHWGKCWLAVLNLYNWDGVNPAPPELWLLPYDYNPIHPGKWWVHTRAVYQPLSYLYTTKYQGPLTSIIKELRAEIFVEEFDSIKWSKHRNDICNIDLYYPHTKFLNLSNDLLIIWEKYLRPNFIKKKSLDEVYKIIQKELYNTGNLCIAPVSYGFNSIVILEKEGKDSKIFQDFLQNFQQVLFLGNQGLTVMGTNGGQVWDVAFVIQYFFISGLAELKEFESMILKSFEFLIKSQFDSNCLENSYRDDRIGAFPYSTKTQGYTVSDCTAEGIKAILMVLNHPNFKDKVKHLVDEELLYKGIDVLLSLQNLGSLNFGAFCSYEKTRASPLLELINPAEVFGNIMVEYPYVECTDSAVLGLTYFNKYYSYRSKDIKYSIEKAIEYICKAQNGDGSWYGCWGICFTYAGMFALEALNSVNKNYQNDQVVKKGCDFLVKRQLSDGGWGENMKSSETHTYINSNESLIVQTSWSLIGLILAKYPNKSIIDKGIEFLIKNQEKSGEWISKGVEGVFNHSCAIEYPNYRFVFTIKALGLYEKMCKDLQS